MMQNTEQSFVQYYAKRKRLEITNFEQPIILCDLQKLTETNDDKESDHCIKLVPELCNISSNFCLIVIKYLYFRFSL